MENEIIQVSGGEMLEAINRSEIDGQIATAHKFPRDIMQCKKNMIALAAMDDDVAYNCFYHLERTSKDGKLLLSRVPVFGSRKSFLPAGRTCASLAASSQTMVRPSRHKAYAMT